MGARNRASSFGSQHEDEVEEMASEGRPLNVNTRTMSQEQRDAADKKAASINRHKQASWLYRRIFHHDMKIQKLATFEDPYHVHKSLGILSICSFFYRYGYCYLTTGTLGFSGDKNDMFDWGTMAVHLCLAFSSKIFRVPAKRLENSPLIIYEEYRQHAMVFTLRCFSVYACAVLGYKEWLDKFHGVACIVAVHHLLADDITRRHGTVGVTAVRTNAEKTAAQHPFYVKVGLAYSFYQFLAIASHIIPTTGPNSDVVLAELGYNAIIAIASSAFMMTLYRKRIIRALAHMVIYSFCLLVSAFHICRHIGWHGTLLTVCAFAVRVSIPRKYSSKYVIWGLFLVVYSYQHELMISQAHLEPILEPIVAPVYGTCSAAYEATVTPAVAHVLTAVAPVIEAIKGAVL